MLTIGDEVKQDSDKNISIIVLNKAKIYCSLVMVAR